MKTSTKVALFAAGGVLAVWYLCQPAGRIESWIYRTLEGRAR